MSLKPTAHIQHWTTMHGANICVVACIRTSSTKKDKPVQLTFRRNESGRPPQILPRPGVDSDANCVEAKLVTVMAHIALKAFNRFTFQAMFQSNAASSGRAKRN